MSMHWKLLAASLIAPGLLGVSGAAYSQASDYYKDKLLNIIVAGGPSGGHTRYARLIGPYLQKHTGAREVRITNMPGGGGLKAANHIVRVKPDGMNIFFGNVATLILAPLAGSPGAQFEPEKFTFLGRATSEPRFLTVGGKSSLQSIDDVKKLNRPFVYPSQGTDEDFYTMAVLSHALGFKMKAVTGYEGNADTALAVIKGDGDGHITGWSESQGAIKAGDKRPILTVASQRHSDYPNVPTAEEIAPADKKSLIRAIVDINETHRSYIGPPGTDAKAAEAFRAALKAVMNDPEFIAETKKGNRPVSFMEGAEQQKIVAGISREGKSLTPILKAAVKDIQ
ncbi:MAG: Bug family tripartite tricarboxylate transporter substrate binding protein [Betaproteobacteria bacterium]